MSYLREGRDWRPKVVVAEIIIILGWGGGMVAIADALSGPFSPATWLQMALVWVGAPLLVTGGSASLGYRLSKSGNETVGSFLIAAPLLLLVFAAIWAVFLR